MERTGHYAPSLLTARHGPPFTTTLGGTNGLYAPMIRLLTVTTLLMGIGLEVLILGRIFDPQGDWQGSEYADIRYYGPVAFLPYVVAFGGFAFSLLWPRHSKTVFVYSAYMAIAGVVLAFVSLRQGAHTAAGLLPIGFFLQWFIISIPLIRALKNRLTNGRIGSEGQD